MGLEQEAGEHACADDDPGCGFLGAEEGAQVELFVEEVLAGVAADDVVVDAELPCLGIEVSLLVIRTL